MAQIPTVIDIEASGFGRGSYPIEVGFVLPNGEALCTLIQPAPDWTHWDPDAERVHGISRQMLLEHGRPVSEVAAMLNASLGGKTVYSDAWAHDFGWLSVLFEEAGRTPLFRLEHLTRIMPELPAAAWNEARAVVEAELCIPRHRASNDARVIQMTWIRLCTM